MTEMILPTNTLPEALSELIPTEKFRVQKDNGIIQIVPVEENIDCTIGLRGMFAGCPYMTVDKYLERKHADKELEP
jgi:hypothetical protein